MSERPITFPKTSDGVWTNRETGVRIERTEEGYRAYRPALGTSRGYVGICRDVPTRTAAREEAIYYVRNSARPAIAAAYVEALSEHIARVEEKALRVGAPTWRVEAARRELGYGWFDKVIREVARLEESIAHMVTSATLCLRADPPHIPHMKAVTSECREEQSGCTKASEWLTPHAYEYDPDEVEAMRDGNGGYDEYERCEKSADDPIHAPELQPKFPAGTPEYEAYAAELKVELGKFARGEHPYEYEQATAAMDDEDSIDDERASADYVRASEVIAEAQTPEVAKPMRLTAPDDVDDDDAWRRYCEALPAPTDDELARVMVDVANPYATEIDAALQAFRTAARNIWYGRRTGTLTEQRYRVQREVMAASRMCIRTYKELAGEWARRSVAAAQR